MRHALAWFWLPLVGLVLQQGTRPPGPRPVPTAPAPAKAAEDTPAAEAAPAKEVRPPAPRVRSAGPKILFEAGDYNLKELVATSCAILKRNELCNWMDNPQHEQERLVIQQPFEVDPKDFERVVASLMFTKKYTLVPVDPANGLWEWIFIPGPSRGEIRKRAQFVPLEQMRKDPPAMRFVITVYPLKRMDANRAVNTLRPYFGTDQTLGFDPLTTIGNSVLISHFTDTVLAVIRVLDIAEEQAPPPAPAETVEVLSRRIEAIEKRLKELAPAPQPGAKGEPAPAGSGTGR